MKFKKVVTNTEFDLGLRIRFVKCYVWMVLLYSMEGWTLKESIMNKLEALEMWVYRRVLRIPWTARRPNDEVLRIINKNREMLDTIKRRKTAYLGHVIRNERYQFLQLIIEGKIKENRGIGRKKMFSRSLLDHPYCPYFCSCNSFVSRKCADKNSFSR